MSASFNPTDEFGDMEYEGEMFDGFDGFEGFDEEDPGQFFEEIPGDDFDYEDEGFFESGNGGADTATAKQAAMLMEMIVDQLAEAEGESEVDDFLPALAALAPLAAKALPLIGKAGKLAAPAIKKAIPHIGRTIVSAARKVAASPQTRQLVRALPTAARNAAADVARHYARTGQVNPQVAARATARQVSRVLRTPSRCRAAIQRNRRVNRRPARPARFA
jgi:hypothetical protein